MVRYRRNVAALILDGQDKLLICERMSVRGAWQFPQGGVDPGETDDEALYREIKEEIGLTRENYQIIKKRDGYRYLYPEPIRSRKLKKHGNHGQEQTYYLCRLNNAASKINVQQSPQEFRDFKWIRPRDFQLKWLPEFKHQVHIQVFKDFFAIDLK